MRKSEKEEKTRHRGRFRELELLQELRLRVLEYDFGKR